MLKLINLFFIIVCITSCSFFNKKIENLASQDQESILPNDNYKILNSSTETKCFDKSTQILFSDEAAQSFYNEANIYYLFLNKSFIQKMALISLLELQRRPDSLSVKSRLQILYNKNGQNFYFDFRPKDLLNTNTMPYFYGINYILEKFSNTNISNFVNLVDNNRNQAVPVSKELENFIKLNIKEINKDSNLKNSFLKGDESITHFETFEASYLEPMYNFYKKNSLDKKVLYESNKNDLSYKNNDPQVHISCNFDFQSDQEISLDNNSPDNETHHYFIGKSNDEFFMAIVSSNLVHPISSFGKSNILNLASPPIPTPICVFENIKKKSILAFSSIIGRSKSQHLKHIIDYEIFNGHDDKEVNDILKFSRHLFLTNPDRILYESKRGRKDQLNFFLSMKFPIYHVDQLGILTGVGKISSKNQIFIDDRSKAKLWCTK
jgi:hypothetical protein